MDVESVVKAISIAKSLPDGWYVFLYEDGTISGALTGVNYPTKPIITTIWGGKKYSDAEIREIILWIKELSKRK